MVLDKTPIKFVFDKTQFLADTITFPSFDPDPDTGVSEFVEFARLKCTAGFLYGMGWGENRGQKESTGRAYARLSTTGSTDPLNGIIRVYAYNAAGISMGLVAELDSTELASVKTDRGTWRVFEDQKMLIKENSTFRFFFMSKEATQKVITKVDSEMYIDGFRVIL